jgi:hypothetical protein
VESPDRAIRLRLSHSDAEKRPHDGNEAVLSRQEVIELGVKRNSARRMPSLVPFEELHRTLVFLGGSARGECAEIPSPPGSWVELA